MNRVIQLTKDLSIASSLARPFYLRLGGVVVALAVMSLSVVAFSFFSGELVSAVVASDNTRGLLLGGILAADLFCLSVSWFLGHYLSGGVEADMIFALRVRLHAALTAARTPAYGSFSDGQLRTNIDLDIVTVARAVETIFVTFVMNNFLLWIALIFIARESILLAGVTVIVLAPLGVVYVYFYRHSIRVAEEGSQVADRFTSNVDAFLSPGGLLRTFATRSRERDLQVFEKSADGARRAALAAHRTRARYHFAISALSALGAMLLIMSGILLKLRGSLDIGSLVAFIGYQQIANQPVRALAQVASSIASAVVSLRRLDKVLSLESRPVRGIPIEGAQIALRGVTYSHGSDVLALRSVNLVVRRGEKIAVVGESGSGKSTLLLMLLGALTPLCGYVEFDAVPLNDCDDRDLRRLLSYDAAELRFVPGSIGENIANDRAADADLILSSARLSECLEFITELPQGFETTLGDALASLSTGQERRVGVARSIAQESEFLLLDEPTSSLDSKTERRLLANLLTLKGAVVVVTHARAHLSRFDRVVELNHGEIIFDGPYREWPDAVHRRWQFAGLPNRRRPSGSAETNSPTMRSTARASGTADATGAHSPS